MLEDRVKLLSEGLARSIDRRKFLRQTGTTVFAGLAALAAGHTMVGRAAASDSDSSDNQAPPWPPRCSPPGPYCNITGQSDGSGCSGSHCLRHLYQGQMLECRIAYNWYPRIGCWTTVYEPHQGYWTCCDCGCGPNGQNVTYCGCAQYNGAQGPPPPQPDKAID